MIIKKPYWLGKNHSSKSRKKMSISQKKYFAIHTHPCKGKKLSLAFRKKLSIARKGIKISEKTKRKLSKILKNRFTMDESSQWKGKYAKYSSIHNWLRIHYGKAHFCINPQCLNNSKTFDYANISNFHDHDIKNYIQLCRRCHYNFDHGKLTYIDLLAQSKL